MILLDWKSLTARLKNFFREDLSEVVGAYFDGEKIFIVRLTKKFETIEVDADDAEPEQLAEKISLVCAQKGWKTSAVGFCLREGDAITHQFEVSNIPAKAFPESVKTWARAEAGADAVFSFVQVGSELWAETLPRAGVNEFVAAFKKFNLNLRGLSVMPVDLLAKVAPFDRTEFISEIVRDKKTPNLLATWSSVWNWKKISCAAAAIFFVPILLCSAKIFFDYREASDKLDAAKISLDEIHDDLILKENLDAIIAELHRLNSIAANIEPEKKFNLLIRLGKIAEGDVRLTKIHVDEKFLELEGLTDKPEAVRNYLGRVRNSVEKSARLENSSERDDGEIFFVIRADLK